MPSWDTRLVCMEAFCSVVCIAEGARAQQWRHSTYVPHLAHLTNADRQLLAFGLDSSQDSRALKLSHRCASLCQMGDS